MAGRLRIINAIAAVQLDIVGVNADAVYGPGGDGTVPGVKELPDDIGVALPAFLMLDGEDELAEGPTGGRERQTWTLQGSVWTEYTPRAERWRELIGLHEPIRAAFRAKSKGNLAVHADLDVQSVILTGFGQVEGRRWFAGPAEAAPTYLVLPYTLEVKVNRTAPYVAA